MKDLMFLRLLRTPYSERWLLNADEKEAAALDVHYMLNGQIAATVIILDEQICPQAQIPELLELIDVRLLPEASVEEGTLTFTVLNGSQPANYVQKGE